MRAAINVSGQYRFHGSGVSGRLSGRSRVTIRRDTLASMSLTLMAAGDGETNYPPMALELSADPRPGRRFEPTVEKSLDGDLLTLAMNLPSASRGVTITREFPGGRGVADIVAVTRWQDGLRKRLSMPQPFLRNETDCAVVAALSANQTRSARSVGKRLGMSDEQVVRRARRLAASGHVEACGSGFRRAPGLEPIGRSYALEAKVSDWQKGISQALRYSTWCDAAAVVLLRPPRDLGELRARCSAFGVGLGVDGRWVVRPRIGRPNEGLRLALSEHWARLMAESELF